MQAPVYEASSVELEEAQQALRHALAAHERAILASVDAIENEKVCHRAYIDATTAVLRLKSKQLIPGLFIDLSPERERVIHRPSAFNEPSMKMVE